MSLSIILSDTYNFLPMLAPPNVVILPPFVTDCASVEFRILIPPTEVILPVVELRLGVVSFKDK